MGLEDREHADVAVHRLVEQQADPVTRPHAPAHQEPRQLVGVSVQLRITQREAVPGVDREMISVAVLPQLVTASLEQTLQAVTLLPPDGVPVSGAGQYVPIWALA